MDTQQREGLQGLLIIAVKNGRLVFGVDLPIRWTLILLGSLATAVGYPVITAIVAKLLHAS